MSIFLVVVSVLLAILVAVLIPMLLQLRNTLASAQQFLDTTRPQVERTLAELTTAAQRVQHVAEGVDERVEQAKQLLGSAQQFVGQVGRVGKTIQTVTAIGGAVGPAIVAAARAFFARSGSEGDGEEMGPEPITEEFAEGGRS